MFLHVGDGRPSYQPSEHCTANVFPVWTVYAEVPGSHWHQTRLWSSPTMLYWTGSPSTSSHSPVCEGKRWFLAVWTRHRVALCPEVFSTDITSTHVQNQPPLCSITSWIFLDQDQQSSLNRTVRGAALRGKESLDLLSLIQILFLFLLKENPLFHNGYVDLFIKCCSCFLCEWEMC